MAILAEGLDCLALQAIAVSGTTTACGCLAALAARLALQSMATAL
jgi:hypothetical protein